MTGKSLFSKTMPFCFAKFVLGGILVLVSALLFAIMMGIGWLFSDGGMFVALMLWLAAIKGIHWVIMHGFGYLVKAGHVAVIAETMKTGQVPANQVDYGKKMVTERFGTSAAYFAIDKLISGAVKQIQGKIDKLGNKLDFVPGMDTLAGATKFFVEIALGYVDECCLGWTFYNMDQNAFKSGADGVLIYVQNWKVVLKNAAITMLKVIVGMILIALAVFVPIGIVFKILKWSALAAFILACLVAWVIKFAFFDSYIMCQMMAAYMQVAPSTTLAFDLYGTLCTFSTSFKELFQKGQAAGGPTTAASASAAPNPVRTAPAQTVPAARPAAAVQTQANPAQPAQAPANSAVPANKPVFCGQCGAKNERGTKFCGSCGAKL